MNKESQIKWYTGGVTAITVLALGAMVYFYNLIGTLGLEKDALYGQVDNLSQEATSWLRYRRNRKGYAPYICQL